jgi:hypothetical protein
MSRFIVKQPGEAGAGRRVKQPVQHIDLLPTILDVVRAPMPPDLRGRSLRAILDKTSGFVADQPIYAELIAPRFRFDGQPLLAVSSGNYRLVRGFDEQLQRLDANAPEADAPRIALLKASLDAFVSARPVQGPLPPAQADADRLAAFGYLEGLRMSAPPAAPGRSSVAGGRGPSFAGASVVVRRSSCALALASTGGHPRCT